MEKILNITTRKRGFLKNYTNREKKNFIFVALMLAFPLAQFIVFWLYINLNTFVLAFQNQAGVFTLINFKKVFRAFSEVGSLNLTLSLKNSFITWCVSLFLVFPSCIMFTYVLFKKVKGEIAFRVIFYLPTIIGAVVMTTLFRNLLSAGGPVISILTKLGFNLPTEVVRNGLLGSHSTAFVSILVYTFWFNIGGNIVIMTGALSRVPSEVLEALKLDTTSTRIELFKVIIPMIWPSISTILIFSLSGIFISDGGTFLLTGNGGYGTSTVGFYIYYHIYMISKSGSNAFNYPAAVGMLFTFMTLPVVLLGRFVIEKFTTSIEY